MKLQAFLSSLATLIDAIRLLTAARVGASQELRARCPVGRPGWARGHALSRISSAGRPGCLPRGRPRLLSETDPDSRPRRTTIRGVRNGGGDRVAGRAQRDEKGDERCGNPISLSLAAAALFYFTGVYATLGVRARLTLARCAVVFLVAASLALPPSLADATSHRSRMPR